MPRENERARSSAFGRETERPTGDQGGYRAAVPTSAAVRLYNEVVYIDPTAVCLYVLGEHENGLQARSRPASFSKKGAGGLSSVRSKGRLIFEVRSKGWLIFGPIEGVAYLRSDRRGLSS